MTVPATETDPGTLPVNPEPAPAPVAPAPQPVRGASEAQKADLRRAAFEKAAATVGKPEPGASAEPAKADGPPLFFTPKKAEEPPAFDPSKLPPELQPVYKSMQADATRKWEEAARMRRETEERQAKLDEERRLMLESQKSLIDALQKGRQPETAEAPSLKDQLQQLRDEGRFAEADELLLKYVDKVAEEKAAPLMKEAEVNLAKTTFNETLASVKAGNPVAAHYWNDIAQVFDGPAPEMVALRQVVLSSPTAMKQFLPMALDYIGSRIHAANLEKNYETAVKAGIEKGLQERRAAAGRTPPRLVESGATSMDSALGKIDLKESFRLAKETVS